MTRIHAAIALHYAPDYFKAFEAALRAYATFHPWEVVFHIMTNTDNEDELCNIEAVCAQHLAETAEVVVHSFTTLKDPFLLTWQHKAIMKDHFLADLNADLFIYAEHDIVIMRQTVDHFLSARELLRSEGLLPGFVRFEDASPEGLKIVDFRRVFKLAADQLKILGNKRFALDYPPYCAFFILDRELAEQHLRSPAYKEESSRALSTMEIRERAAIGELYSDVPGGRVHRYALLLDDDYQPDKAAWVWHSTNNYSSNPDSAHGKVSIAKCVSPSPFVRIKALFQ